MVFSNPRATEAQLLSSYKRVIHGFPDVRESRDVGMVLVNGTEVEVWTSGRTRRKGQKILTSDAVTHTHTHLGP